MSLLAITKREEGKKIRLGPAAKTPGGAPRNDEPKLNK